MAEEIPVHGGDYQGIWLKVMVRRKSLVFSGLLLCEFVDGNLLELMLKKKKWHFEDNEISFWRQAPWWVLWSHFSNYTNPISSFWKCIKTTIVPSTGSSFVKYLLVEEELKYDDVVQESN